MLKAIGRTLIILLIAFAIGWGSSLLIQNTPQRFTRGGFGDGGRPNFANQQGFPPRGDFNEGFRGDDGGFRGRAGFGLSAGFAGILGHLFLFVIVTLLVVLVGKLFSRKPVPTGDQPPGNP